MGLRRFVRRLIGRDQPIVPVVRLHGPIGHGPGRRGGGLNVADLAVPLERAFKVPGAKAVALIVNSPGGSPVQSALIARRIRLLADEKKLPVLAFCEDVAASGGYWLAAAGDEIFVDDSSIVGSIGVIYAGFGFVELIAKLGIDRRVHTAGTRKALLDPFGPERKADVGHLKAVQGEIHAAFIDYVKARRGDRLKGDADAMFSGAFWAGRTGVAMGLADAVGDLRGVLRQRYGAKVRLVLVNPPKRRSWWRLGARQGPADWLAEIAAAAEERALWDRFGL
ncbi:MAG: S49 family peptidase [Alphaproteobacteria bacterium]